MDSERHKIRLYSNPERDVPLTQEEKAYDAYQEADPTTHSALYHSDSIPDYHELAWKQDSALSEQIVVRMLKGVINVSDIVAQKGVDDSGKSTTRLYSKELDLKKIEKKTSADEVKADIALLELLFNDNDHSLVFVQNLVHDPMDSKVAYFDFNVSQRFFNHRYFLQDLDEMSFFSNPAMLSFIKSKLELLNTRFAGEEGRLFLKNIVMASGKSISEMFENAPDGEEGFTEFYSIFMERISLILRKIATFPAT